MALHFQGSVNGAPSGERAYANGPPGDWDALIRECVIWGLALLAFACGLIASLATFGTKDQIALLLDRTKDLGGIISRTNAIDAHVGALVNELHVVEQNEKDRDAPTERVDAIDPAVDRLSNEIGIFVTELRDRQATFDERVRVIEEKVAHLDFTPVASTNIGGNDPNQVTEFRKARVAARRGSSVTNFSIVRLTGDTAWLAGPQGWLHVAVGTQLPSGARVTDIGRRNNRAVVFTDQGDITRAP